MWIAIGAGVVATLAFFFVMFVVVPKIVIDKVRERLEQRVVDEVPADQVVQQDITAVSLGLGSRGVGQSRGNGALVLTPTELRWLQLKPTSSDVTIPLAAITTVDTARSHLGKRYGKPLLRVTFDAGAGPDTMAWLTTDLSGWLAALAPADAAGGPEPAVEP